MSRATTDLKFDSAIPLDMIWNAKFESELVNPNMYELKHMTLNNTED